MAPLIHIAVTDHIAGIGAPAIALPRSRLGTLRGCRRRHPLSRPGRSTSSSPERNWWRPWTVRTRSGAAGSPSTAVSLSPSVPREQSRKRSAPSGQTVVSSRPAWSMLTITSTKISPGRSLRPSARHCSVGPRALYPLWALLDEEAVYLSTFVGLAELALGGCTTTTDHLYVHPSGGGDLLAAEIAAAREIGVRFHPDSRFHERLREGRWPSPRLCVPGRGHDPRRQRSGCGRVPRPLGRRHGAHRARRPVPRSP